MNGNHTSEGTVKTKRKSHPVTTQYLINKFNYVNFQDIVLTARFIQKQYNREVWINVKALPCLDGRVHLVFASEDEIGKLNDQLEFDALYIPDNGQTLRIEAEHFCFEENGFSFTVTDACVRLSERNHTRYPCTQCTALLLQNGTLFKGTISEFSINSFVLHLNADFPYSFTWLNPDIPATVTLQRGRQLLYSGESTVLRWDGDEKKRKYVVVPDRKSIKRFKPKQFRSSRHQVSSPIHVSFDHPLTGVRTELTVFDISGSGFSVREKKGAEMLFPGLIIPQLNLVLPGGIQLCCTIQVINQREFEQEEKNEEIRKGCSILTMDSNQLTTLHSFIHQEDDESSFIDCGIDLNELWKFFFESGFIYPEKYEYFLTQKEEIKATFEKLYINNPSIGKYFVSKKNGSIHGHMAMVRSYENSWLLHHHAANMKTTGYAGIKVLHQAGSFTNSCHRIPSMHMDYLMCYFRPENKFPVKVFQGIAQKIDEPKNCSIDSFAYFHSHYDHIDASLPRGWSLLPSSSYDLLDFNAFYEHISGGLLPSAFHLQSGAGEQPTLIQDYKDAGLHRKIALYSLKYNGSLRAVFIADFSNPGLNMSELMNCLKVFVTDPDETPSEVLDKAIQMMIPLWNEKEVPVLLFPAVYTADRGIPYEKTYMLWILHMEASDKYFTYLNKIFRTIKH